jgi:hypothetical protein
LSLRPRRGRALAVLLAAGVLGGGRPAQADVVESAPGGFVVRTVASVAATPARAYDVLVRDVGLWWDPEHTYSGDAKNLSIDPRPGGCFCEALAKGGGVQHMTVVLAMPGQRLRMAGALGPLQEAAVAGSLTWEIEDKAGQAEITMTYVAGGFRSGGLQGLAPLVDAVLATQVRRLKSQLEKGTPAAPAR